MIPRTGRAIPAKERFDHLLKVIASERFLKKQGLGNEVPFFICPYPADEAVAMEGMRSSLINQLKSRGVRAFEINLYDLGITLLRERGIWDEVLAAEPDISKAELKELLQGVLDPETHLVPEIGVRLAQQEFDAHLADLLSAATRLRLGPQEILRQVRAALPSEPADATPITATENRGERK